MLTLDELYKQDMEKVEKANVEWHPSMRCQHCGERMFWQETWSMWVCETWIYMEGGCYWDEPN